MGTGKEAGQLICSPPPTPPATYKVRAWGTALGTADKRFSGLCIGLMEVSADSQKRCSGSHIIAFSSLPKDSCPGENNGEPQGLAVPTVTWQSHKVGDGKRAGSDHLSQCDLSGFEESYPRGPWPPEAPNYLVSMDLQQEQT